MGEDDGESKMVELVGDEHAKDTRVYTDPAYPRTIYTWAVTFTCKRCGREVTQQRFPGAWPLYCSAACREAVIRKAMRERVRRLREPRRQEREEL